ncbi:MAG: hypothetical protein ACRD5Z_05110 [Bryobacteraceae bacterium]
MAYDPAFDSAQNKALLVVCARKTIRNAAIAGIVWGGINLFIGYFAVLANPLNAGILALALLMLGTGLAALKKPSLGALLSEAIVSLLLLCWNVGIAIRNARAGYADHIEPRGLIIPAIAAAAFFIEYKKLGYLKEAIASMDHAMVKEASTICKQIFKTRLKQSPDIVQASSKRCRLKLMSDSVLCVQRNLARAFSLNRTDFQQCILHPEKARLRVVVRHPLGKLTYAFDRKNSAKIKEWLGTGSLPNVNPV